jgi:peptide/nickel transport system permease protein
MDEALLLIDTLEVEKQDATPVDPRRRSWRSTLSFVRHHPLLVLSFAFLALIVVASVVPGLLAPYAPNTAVLTALQQAPSSAHLFGTDELGRDVFSRVIYGTQITLIIGILSTLLAAIVGGLVGLVAGYTGGILDIALMRMSEILLAFPGILLALAIVAAAGPNEKDLILAVGIAAMPTYAKLMRNQVHAVRERPYIEASVSTGARRRTIVFGHLLPNAYSSLLGLATLGVGINILAGSSLSFLGLGPPPPSPEWGAMVADSAGEIATSWWMALFPGLAIILTVLAVSVVGQWLRARVDVRSGERA